VRSREQRQVVLMFIYARKIALMKLTLALGFAECQTDSTKRNQITLPDNSAAVTTACRRDLE
jgi:hypothetical protein